MWRSVNCVFFWLISECTKSSLVLDHRPIGVAKHHEGYQRQHKVYYMLDILPSILYFVQVNLLYSTRILHHLNIYTYIYCFWFNRQKLSQAHFDWVFFLSDAIFGILPFCAVEMQSGAAANTTRPLPILSQRPIATPTFFVFVNFLAFVAKSKLRKKYKNPVKAHHIALAAHMISCRGSGSQRGRGVG